jgi:hypothetical protein
MEISLRPGHDVPDIFVERMQTRALGEQVLATTMSIDFSNNPIVDGLVAHGLPEDILAVDYYGHANGPSALLLGHHGHHEARTEFERNFPGSYVVLGEPEHDKYYEGKVVHRSHIKALAVGSRVLSLGGVNFINFGYDHFVDALLDFESVEFTDFLTSFIAQNGNLRGRAQAGEQFALTEQSSVLVDYGKNHQSFIMERLLADLGEDGVQAATMSSSYAPAGRLYRSLHGIAEAGKPVTIYTNHASKFQGSHASMLEEEMQGEELAYIALGSLGRQYCVTIIDSLPQGTFNHFKAMVIEKEAGNKVAYMLSHNMHPLSVRFGTAEVALRTTDPAVIEQIAGFIEDNLALSSARPLAHSFDEGGVANR